MSNSVLGLLLFLLFLNPSLASTVFLCSSAYSPDLSARSLLPATRFPANHNLFVEISLGHFLLISSLSALKDRTMWFYSTSVFQLTLLCGISLLHQIIKSIIYVFIPKQPVIIKGRQEKQ